MPVFADYHRTVIGFHGTLLNKALSIVSGFEELEASQNHHDWLGNGIYFWEYGPKQAWKWARQRYPDPKAKIAVVAAMIRLGNCLDLVDPDNALMLRGMHDDMVEKRRRAKKKIPRNVRSRKYLDCAVMEHAYNVILRMDGVAVDSARAVYVPSGSEKQKRLWPSSWMSCDTHIQICVRNRKNIFGCWLIRPTEGMER